MQGTGRNAPGFNGGIVMAMMARGLRDRFEKPGVYAIGGGEKSLKAGGAGIVRAVRMVTPHLRQLPQGHLFIGMVDP